MNNFIPTYGEYAAICESNLTSHAEYELRKAGMYDGGEEIDGKYNSMVADAVLGLIKQFAEQGHSGFSASMVIAIFGKLAKFEPLTPISSDPEEWCDVAEECDGNKLWQNKRSPVHFSTDGGKTWYNVDDKQAQTVAEAFAPKLNEEIDPQDEAWKTWFDRRDAAVEYWAIYGGKYYEDVFLPTKTQEELDKAYVHELLKVEQNESHPLAKAALNYFYEYRRNQLQGIDPNSPPQQVKHKLKKMMGVHECSIPMFEHVPGQKPKWFTLKQSQYDYFVKIADGDTGNRVNDYALRILMTIKQNNMRCSENQYEVLKRMELGKDKPKDYPHTN